MSLPLPGTTLSVFAYHTTSQRSDGGARRFEGIDYRLLLPMDSAGALSDATDAALSLYEDQRWWLLILGSRFRFALGTKLFIWV